MDKTKKDKAISYPSRVLMPVKSFLGLQLRSLHNRKKEVSESDPFKDVNRISDNAAPDADAEEQFGHARSSAIKEQLDRKIIQTKKALARIRMGKYGICEECGNMIDTDRLMAYPEATLCVKCESKAERA